MQRRPEGEDSTTGGWGTAKPPNQRDNEEIRREPSNRRLHDGRLGTHYIGKY